MNEEWYIYTQKGLWGVVQTEAEALRIAESIIEDYVKRRGDDRIAVDMETEDTTSWYSRTTGKGIAIISTKTLNVY